jgi:hypothetical protein
MTMTRSITITEVEYSDAHRHNANVARKQWRNDNPADTRYQNIPTEFVGVDGEGVTKPDGSHYYVLLGVGDQQITNPNGLGFEECLEFLWDNFRTGSVAYVGFFLGYDFVQMFKQLPEERARMLLTKQGRAKRAPKNPKRVQPFPVEYNGWEFDILGNKRLKIRKAGSKRWMNICDTGPFFQKSFLKVIDPNEWSDPIVTQEEYDLVAQGKSHRSSASLDRDMLRYNRLENEILARVMCKLNEGFQSLDIHLAPGQWFGPGQAAQAWLKGKAITSETLREITPLEVLEHARESYFGGWFEIMAHGIIPGITYEYDINSAYPYIISTLPCLEHGEWVHNDPDCQWETLYTLVYARVRGDDRNIGTMLHRDTKGNISRPDRTEGWYWLHEIVAAKRAGIISDDPDILDSWTYRPCSCIPPFVKVRDIYALRKQVGKKTPLGIACKLVPNSLYGKFAQSIGNPEFSNPIYASLITAGTRTMILNAIATHPRGTNAVRMVATDGVYFSEPHPNLPITGNLGDWDTDKKTNIRLFKPGVYWDDKAIAAVRDGISPVFKARGVNARDFGQKLEEVDRLFRAMESEDDWPVVRFPLQFMMITAIQALMRNDWTQAGTLVKSPEAKQSSNPARKRCDGYWDDDGVLRTHPIINRPYVPSLPYEKRFGMILDGTMEDPFNFERDYLTREGQPGMTLREALGIS